MEHGLDYIMSYVHKHIAPLAICYHPPLVCDTPLGAPAFVRLVYASEVYLKDMGKNTIRGPFY